jgi:hypothetical protein
MRAPMAVVVTAVALGAGAGTYGIANAATGTTGTTGSTATTPSTTTTPTTPSTPQTAPRGDHDCPGMQSGTTQG